MKTKFSLLIEFHNGETVSHAREFNSVRICYAWDAATRWQNKILKNLNNVKAFCLSRDEN